MVQAPSDIEASVDSPASRLRGRYGTASPRVRRQGAEPRFPLLSYGIAIVVLLGFAFFVDDMLDYAKTAGEKEWGRRVLIFNSVQSLAFGAAGLLFGTSIERANTRAAQQQTRQANDDAKNAREVAALAIGNGKRLREEIERLATPKAVESGRVEAPAGLHGLVVTAAKLFPPE